MSSPDAVCVSGYLSVCISGVTYVLLLRLQPHTWGGGSAGLHLRSHLQLCSWPLGSLACPVCPAHTRAGVGCGRWGCGLPPAQRLALGPQQCSMDISGQCAQLTSLPLLAALCLLQLDPVLLSGQVF